MTRIFVPLLATVLALAMTSCTRSGGPLDSAAAQSAASEESARIGSQAAMPPPPVIVGPIEGTTPVSTGLARGRDGAPLRTPASVAAAGSLPFGSGSATPAPAPRTIAVDRRASSLIGMKVESASGAPLGFIEDIILNRSGRATHLVIAFGDGGNGGKLTAIPWRAAVSSLHDSHLVIARARLEKAPSFLPGQWPDINDPAWSATADAYWRAGTGPIAPPLSTPIDSTARTRSRPSRPP